MGLSVASFLILIILLVFVLPDKIMQDVFKHGEHIIFVFLLGGFGMAFQTFISYYLLDPWLNFREINQAMERQKDNCMKEGDKEILSGAGSRSGFVYLGNTLVFAAVLVYMDF